MVKSPLKKSNFFDISLRERNTRTANDNFYNPFDSCYLGACESCSSNHIIESTKQIGK